MEVLELLTEAQHFIRELPLPELVNTILFGVFVMAVFIIPIYVAVHILQKFSRSGRTIMYLMCLMPITMAIFIGELQLILIMGTFSIIMCLGVEPLIKFLTKVDERVKEYSARRSYSSTPVYTPKVNTTTELLVAIWVDFQNEFLTIKPDGTTTPVRDIHMRKQLLAVIAKYMRKVEVLEKTASSSEIKIIKQLYLKLGFYAFL